MTSSDCSSSNEAFLSAQTLVTVVGHKDGYIEASLSILKSLEFLSPYFLQTQ